jgi:mono/diheme cytochrome c family protein
MSTVEETSSNGTPTAVEPDQPVGVELSVAEAEALRAWLMKPAADGTTALDDSLVKAATGKLSTALDKVQAVVTVRRELEEAGFQTDGLTDEQIAALGSRISQTALHRLS